MSWSERHVQDHKERTDCAIHCACAQLALDPSVFTKLNELLSCARARAPRLFEAPFCEGRHLGVEALVNLSRFRYAHVRQAIDWAGTSATWRPAVSSLAHHLICDYNVPVFLSSCWYATDAGADRKRGWFVTHSRGASFRSLDLPIVMTRRMERLFLASQDHVPIEHAMRRAELLALNMPHEFVKAIMSTSLAIDMRDGEFWRTVWMFLITNAYHVEATQIGPLIDYIQEVRRDRTQHGLMAFGSAEPAFSVKGRTVQSMMRLMGEWHRGLGHGSPTLSWVRSPFEPLIIEQPARDESALPTRWQMLELVNSAQLRCEGSELHHCVASYANRCHRGVSSIWSLRFWHADKFSRVLTVEVDPKRRTVIQARGRANHAAAGKPLGILQEWAVRERLRMAI